MWTFFPKEGLTQRLSTKLWMFTYIHKWKHTLMIAKCLLRYGWILTPENRVGSPVYSVYLSNEAEDKMEVIHALHTQPLFPILVTPINKQYRICWGQNFLRRLQGRDRKLLTSVWMIHTLGLALLIRMTSLLAIVDNFFLPTYTSKQEWTLDEVDTLHT